MFNNIIFKELFYNNQFTIDLSNDMENDHKRWDVLFKEDAYLWKRVEQIALECVYWKFYNIEYCKVNIDNKIYDAILLDRVSNSTNDGIIKYQHKIENVFILDFREFNSVEEYDEQMLMDKLKYS